MPAILFDIDGTLIDSTGFDGRLYRQAVRETVGAVRFRDSWADYEHVTDAGILAQILDDNDLSPEGRPMSVTRARFGELISDRLSREPCRQIPGAHRVLQGLLADPKIGIGVATGGWRLTAEMKLASAGFSVDGVPFSTADDASQRVEIMKACLGKLPPTSGGIVYVGDGVWDLKAAAELGWGFIGVGERLRGRSELWVEDFSSEAWPRLLAQALK